MKKITRRLKKNKKNRTFKRGGAGIFLKNPENLESTQDLPKEESQEQITEKLQSPEDSPKKERQGIIDIIQNKISDTASFVGDTGLKMIGLQKIKSKEEEENDNSNKFGAIASIATFAKDAGLKVIGLQRINKSKEEDEVSKKMTDAVSFIDKTGSNVIDNVNQVLESNNTAEKTASSIKNLAENFNKALDKPEVKAEVKESIEKAGELGAIVVEASEKPLQKAVDVASGAIQKATGSALSGIIKVGTDMMGAVPGVGAVIEVGKMLNDSSKAVSAVVEAGSEAVEAASDAFIETNANVKQSLKELDEKKKIGNEISSRTDESIKDFENPVVTDQTTNQVAGARKTRRRLLKHRGKSKRVRFAI